MMRLFKRRTVEEKRLARHTKLMGRVKGDIVIKPIPFFTEEDLDQAVRVEESCQSCGTYVGARYSYCDECSALNQACFITDDLFDKNSSHGLRGLSERWVNHVPMGVESAEDGEWVHEGLSFDPPSEDDRSFIGLSRVLPNVPLESLTPGEPA